MSVKYKLFGEVVSEIIYNNWMEMECNVKQLEAENTLLKDRLDHEVKIIDCAARDEIGRLEADNKKLKGCVEFYADKENWQDTKYNTIFNIFTKDDLGHSIGDGFYCGKLARQTLAEIEIQRLEEAFINRGNEVLEKESEK